MQTSFTSRIKWVILYFCLTTALQAAAQTIRDRDGNIYPVKRMPDQRLWMTRDLNIKVDSSWCFSGDEANCRIYGRMYTYASAAQACETLRDGWRLPSRAEWETLAAQYGGASNHSKDGGKSAYAALQTGGISGFNATLGGNRGAKDQVFARLNAHGFYWTTTEIDAQTAWTFNFGAGGKALHCQDGGEKGEAVSVRCIQGGL